MSAHDQFSMLLCPKRRVRRMCAEAFGIEEHRLVGHSRVREVVIPRHATFYVLRHRFPLMSLPSIARFMGGRDHSTIIHGIRAITARMERDEALRQTVTRLIAAPLPEPQKVRAPVVQRAAVSVNLTRSPGAKNHALGPDSELAAFAVPGRQFCEQCDRAVTITEAERCSRRLCSVRVAA